MDEVTAAHSSSAATAPPKPLQLRLADESAFKLQTIGKPDGLTIKALPNGCIYSIEHTDIQINQILASPLGGGIHRIFLRIFDGGDIHFNEIVGPGTASEFTAAADHFLWTGSWRGLKYSCICKLSDVPNCWTFQIKIENRTGKTAVCDAVLLQDIGLATRGHVRNNERYTSQYLDHLAADHPDFGTLLMTRQNLAQLEGKHPWLLQGCFPRVSGYCTDGFDFFGTAFKATGIPRALTLTTIGQKIRQYEAAFTVMQSGRAEISPESSQSWSFFSQFSPDHPEPSSASDVDDRLLKNLRNSLEKQAISFSALTGAVLHKPRRTLFQTAKLFEADDFNEQDIQTHFPGPLRHEEYDGNRRLSLFVGSHSRHVVFKSKELVAERPHGQIMRSGQGYLPDAEVVSTTCYAAGVFASQLAVGNTVFGKFISTVRDSLNIIRSSGLRIFVRRQSSDPWELLGVPSAFEMATDFARWYYKSSLDLLTVICRATGEDPVFSLEIQAEKHPVEAMICGEISAGPQEYDSSPQLTIDARRSRFSIRPDGQTLLAQKQPNIAFHAVTSTPHAVAAMGGDELLGHPVSAPYFAVLTHPTKQFSLGFIGDFGDPVRTEALCTKYESFAPAEPATTSKNPTGGIQIFLPSSVKASELQDALVWMARDALIHFSVPRGLEQANGGAWGVRDVCQGPVEFFLAQGRGDLMKDIIFTLFSQQYLHRGDWPQWFMFPPFQQVQARDSHGDILIWPLKALCDYLEQTNDGDILHHRLAYTDEETFDRTEKTESILQHVDRLLERLRQQFLPGLSLVRYGEGDWDDSLQPACKDLADHMTSSWTVALIYQTLRRYCVALARFGQEEKAAVINELTTQIRADFQRFLIPDGVVAGFAIFGSEPGYVDRYMLHPSDSKTGIHYRLISMTRGILSGIFSPEQARLHLELVKKHLLFPDGARLMDRPTKYQGGRETVFRRSESASFFGREIGLQYVHAHLRYAEALAAMGDGKELLEALRVVNPIAVTNAVKNGRLRQRNCYFSSSDAAFNDRYEAFRDYEKLRRGEIPVDGGWRIYSSGPGIYTNLVVRHLLGFRRYYDLMEFDPVLPAEFDGIGCELPLGERKVRYLFSRVNGAGRSRRVLINGTEIRSAVRVEGTYRPGGIRIKISEFEAALNRPDNSVLIES